MTLSFSWFPWPEGDGLGRFIGHWLFLFFMNELVNRVGYKVLISATERLFSIGYAFLFWRSWEKWVVLEGTITYFLCATESLLKCLIFNCEKGTLLQKS